MLPAIRRAGARYVVTIHDATLHPGERFLPYQWWLDWEIQQANGYVVLSDHVGRVLRARHQESMDRITVAPCGPFSQFADTRRGCVKADERPAPRRLLFFGRIVAYKGLDLLLEAYGLLKCIHPDLSLAIYGDGDLTPYRAAIDALADVTVENRYIPEDELSGILEQSDLIVLPYREASQSGVMVLAEAAGVPVVGTPTGALVEQIVPGVNGLIADAVDGKALAYAIGRFLDDPALYQRCVMGISRHAEDRWSEAGERISRLLLGAGTSAPSAPSYAAVTQATGEARARLPQRRTAR
jgi:glycosyltransferase involved in cell wall biosynthesis